MVIPQPAAGEDGPLAVPVFAEEVTIPGPAGRYEFAATLEHGGAPAAGRLMFQVSEAPRAEAAVEVAVVAVEPWVQEWLKARSISAVPLDKAATNACQVIVVGNAPEPAVTAAERMEVLRCVARGASRCFSIRASSARGTMLWAGCR